MKCECRIEWINPNITARLDIAGTRSDIGTPTIVYCPLHEAAGELYEACKSLRGVLYQVGLSLPPKWFDENPVLAQCINDGLEHTAAALAKAENR